MYLFMISCYVLMAFNLINLFISVAMGIWNFFLGSNHAQFSLFAILVFVLAETIVMYFFIATGKSIKEILSKSKYLNCSRAVGRDQVHKKINIPTDNVDNIAYWRIVYFLLRIYYFQYTCY